jgi:transcriptional regulator of NAD metabolism
VQEGDSAGDEIGLIERRPGPLVLEVSMSTSLDTTVVFAGELRAQVRRASLELETAACSGEDVLEHPAWGRIAELLDIARRHNVEI